MRNIALLGALLLVSATGAQAQLAPGYSGTSTAPVVGTEEEFWYSLAELGRCFAAGRARQVQALLTTRRGTAAENRAFDTLMGRYTSCLRAAHSLRAARPTIRSALAEGMYKQMTKTPLSPVAFDRPREMTMEEARALGPIGILGTVADCFVARHPAQAHGLVTGTPMGTRAEADAVGRYGTMLAQCTPPRMRLQFDPSDLRLAIAEALYRRAAEAPAAESSAAR